MPNINAPKSKKSAKIGRPKIEIDKSAFEKLCSIMCTLEEISGVFGCSEDTIERFCKREYDMTFAEVFKKKSSNGKISLRRAQFQLAQVNASMAIFLGKQYLGQKDVVEKEEETKECASVLALSEKLKSRAVEGVVSKNEDGAADGGDKI